ncbi:MAG: hypothetical protein E7476_03860 [Ruminococcaceae bacterium]|nr:hypothetical protein [Oscillospiraceae bacterium]
MKKSYRALKIATVFFAGLAMVILAVQAALKALLIHSLRGQLNIGAGDAAAIGIIGGADGPTAIYVATQYVWGNPYIWAGVCAFLAAAGFITLLILKKRAK